MEGIGDALSIPETGLVVTADMGCRDDDACDDDACDDEEPGVIENLDVET